MAQGRTSRKGQILNVSMNGRLVGRLTRQTSGAIEFQYDRAWLEWQNSMPVSLSMPLREERYTGRLVTNTFDNLLPDSADIRLHLAERTGAEGTDAFSLLDAIGRDCVGALQFIAEGAKDGDAAGVQGRPIENREIENILLNLKRVPLGAAAENDFRISIAGVQQKTALLRRRDHWEMPSRATPTTHIIKPAIGRLPNGLDLSASVENEHFCLTLLNELGIAAARSEMAIFGKTKALVVERFDRVWAGDRILRRPQEDMCQALGIPWTQKYENEGGPGIYRILDLLKASDEATADRKRFITAQILFWLMGATDGHAKNFSIHLFSAGRFMLTPVYDVMSAQPNVDMKQIRKKDFKLAMAVGDGRHYGVNDILPRHYYQMAAKADMPHSIIDEIFAQLLETVPSALERAIAAMPNGFPSRLADSIAGGVTRRLGLVT
jgi:serine/threonine-protein kinase HipA